VHDARRADDADLGWSFQGLAPSLPRGSAAAAKNLGTGVLAARPAGRITDREAKKRRPAAAKLVASRAFKLALSDAVGWLYSREIYRGAL